MRWTRARLCATESPAGPPLSVKRSYNVAEDMLCIVGGGSGGDSVDFYQAFALVYEYLYQGFLDSKSLCSGVPPRGGRADLHRRVPY